MASSLMDRVRRVLTSGGEKDVEKLTGSQADNRDPRPKEGRLWGISKQSREPTALLLAWRAGDAAALDRLVSVVHDELHRIARRHMRHEPDGHTLQASALVNEVYLRLIEIKQVQWQNRVPFVAMTSRIMRRILVDAARAKAYQKRGAARNGSRSMRRRGSRS